MASRRRSSLSAREVRGKGAKGSARGSSRDARAKAAKGASRTDSAQIAPPVPRIAPLYKRLPHGPHRLARNEVVLNQRARIHGAMVEAIGRDGYEKTSVKQVIGLAGVSRRSFYEQFANKQECFLATFDLVARRELQHIRHAYLAGDGLLEARVRASFQRFAQTLAEDRNAMILTLLEAQRAGVPGLAHLRRATGTCERMLAQSFTPTNGAVALPMPIVRGIAGGLHGAAVGYLRRSSDSDKLDIAEELTRWTLLFQTPSAERMTEHMTASLSARIREISSAYGHGLSGAEPASHDERTRLLQGVLRLVTREDQRALSAPQIAEEANVSIDAFCELFVDKDECFLAALDMVGDELLAIAADPGLISEDWPRAVRKVLAELMCYLADHPLQARAIAQEAFFAGADAFEHTVELSQSIATLLTEGAPAQAQVSMAVEAIAGAIWHTIRCQVAAGRIPLLAALSDHLTYIVLAPFIGAEEAIAILSTESEQAQTATR